MILLFVVNNDTFNFILSFISLILKSVKFSGTESMEILF